MQVVHIGSEQSLVGGTPNTYAELRFKRFSEMAKWLRTLVNSYPVMEEVRELTLKIIFPATEARDKVEQALTIGSWVQDHIHYVHEGRENFQRPKTTLRLEAGDCDDMTILIAAMLQSVGIQNKMCIVRINGRWAHIFPIALIPDKGRLHRLTLDATLSDPVRNMVNPLTKATAQGAKVECIFV